METIEVFRTNVNDPDHARRLLYKIHHTLTDYKANFDLEDCDRILRVSCTTGLIQHSFLIDLLKNDGFDSEVLPDTCFSHQANGHLVNGH